jgi:glycosyltransferase involved in cell wall biosynthesis
MTTTARPKILERSVGANAIAAASRVSVVIPAYNSAAFIGETLDSVFAQTFTEYEVILVNDGSPDTADLEKAISPYGEKLTYIRQQNGGAGAARNTAVEASRGELIAFLDADDIWNADYLSLQIAFLDQNSLDMAYCDAVVFAQGSPATSLFTDTAPSVGEVTAFSLLAGTCNVITSGTVLRRSVLDKAGLFEWERVLAEDFHLWMRIALAGGRIGYQREPLLKYRVHPTSLSGDSIDRVKRSIGAYERVRATLDLSTDELAELERKLVSFQADLAVEVGKDHLAKGDHIAAAASFRAANRHRRSLKLAAAAVLSRCAPQLLLRSYLRKTPQTR